jgi:hypothetical protein
MARSRQKAIGATMEEVLEIDEAEWLQASGASGLVEH